MEIAITRERSPSPPTSCYQGIVVVIKRSLLSLTPVVSKGRSAPLLSLRGGHYRRERLSSLRGGQRSPSLVGRGCCY